MFISANENTQELIDACGLPDKRSSLCEWAYNTTSSKQVAEVADFLSKPLKVLGIILVAYLVNRIARFMIKRTINGIVKDKTRQRYSTFKRRTGLSKFDTSETPSHRLVQRGEALSTVLKGIASFLIYTIAIILILQALDVQLTPVLASAGILSAVLGFGAQTMVRDFLAGVFIIAEDWYGVGDVVDIGQAAGTIEQVTLRATRLRDINGVVWNVPNGEILRAGNKSQKWGRAVLDIGVALDTDIDFAKSVIKEAADTLASDGSFQNDILDDPDVLGVEEIGTDRIIIRVIVKTTPTAQWNIARELRERIKIAFDEKGIELPPPVAPSVRPPTS